MTTRWWPYSAFFLCTYGGYPAGGCHPPWYLLIGPNEGYLPADVAPLPSHCLGTEIFINGLLHASFIAMWPSLIPGSRILFGSMYLSHAASGKIVLLKYLQLLSITPKKTCARQPAPTFYSCSLSFSHPNRTASTPRFCGALIPNNFFRNKK